MHSRRSSLSLVEGLVTKDELYWRRLNSMYGPIVDYWIHQADVPVYGTEDIKQEVFLAVARNIESYKHSPERVGSLRRWIWGIARNKIIDFRRHEEKQLTAKGGARALIKLSELPQDPYEESSHDVSNQIRRELVTRALKILESDFQEKTWMAFWRLTIEEQPAADVAESLKMTNHAVRQAKYRVLQRLRDELGEEFPC